jgi:hypothetical protein
MFNWDLKMHHIFWEIKHFENSKRMELRKFTKKKSSSKGKEKERRE